MGAVKPAHGSGFRFEAPERNRYFHGQLLGVRQFELETEYHSRKRWLVNRLILGYGVVCGLAVRTIEGEEAKVVVEPGFAIDRWGREILVEKEAGPIGLPPHLLNEDAASGQGEPAARSTRHAKPNGDHDEEKKGLHVVLCYHECVAEPTAVLAGDCRDEEPCQPGLIRERYTIDIRPGCLRPRHPRLSMPDVISDGRLDYEALVKAVSEPCPKPHDPCIPLANLFLDFEPKTGRCTCRREVDLTVRPIVYTNDLLLQLILAAVVEAPSYPREK
jgi:hypothetical protein